MKKTNKLMLLSGGLALSLSLPATAFAESVTLTATLAGANETKGGDPDGSGSFSADVDTETGDFCYTLAVENISDPVAAHVHSGVAGSDGKPVTELDVTGPEDDECIAMEPDTLKLIVATPAAYYVNVHTKDFPAGAVRGQLAKEGGSDATADASVGDQGSDTSADAPADQPADAPMGE